MTDNEALPNYFSQIMGLTDEMLANPGIYVATVKHDDWCDFWNGGDIQSGKACNCHPVVTHSKVEETNE